MNKPLLICLALLGAIALLASCKDKKKMADTPPPPPPVEAASQGKPEGVVDMIVLERGYQAKKTDPYSIEKAEIIKDVLHIKVRYSGGCEDHAFKMFFNQMYAKSLPPQITLNLEHNANGDSCRELVTEDLYFYLDNVKYDGTDKMIIRINDLKIEPLVYEYKG